MTLNPIKYFRERKQQRQQQLEAEQLKSQMLQLATLIETLDLFERNQLLHRHQNGTILIANLLAQQYLYDDAQWQQFLHNLAAWGRYHYLQQRYNTLYVQALADAEHQAAIRKGNGTPQALNPDERAEARMQAAVNFDSFYGAGDTIKVPPFIFLVLGAADGHPILRATLDLKTDRYLTTPIGEE